MDNLRLLPLPELPTEWVEQIEAEIADASQQLEGAKTLEDVRHLQGEIKAYRTILTAKATQREQQKRDAEIAAKKAAEEAENARLRSRPGWERVFRGTPKHPSGDGTTI